MIDRVFTALLTFALLTGGTLAIGSALLEIDPRSVAAQTVRSDAKVVQLERVVVIGKRQRSATAVAQRADSDPATRRVE